MNPRVGAWLLVRSLGFLGLLLILGYVVVPSFRPALPVASLFGLLLSAFAAVFAARWVERGSDERARATDDLRGCNEDGRMPSGRRRTVAEAVRPAQAASQRLPRSAARV